MEIKEIIDFLFQYGVGFVCLGYLIYYNLTVAKENQKINQQLISDMQKTNQEIVVALTKINERLDDIERKLKD